MLICYISALHGHCEVTTYLLKEFSYDINCKDSCGTTPLFDALRAGHVKVAGILLENGVSEKTAETYNIV